MPHTRRRAAPAATPRTTANDRFKHHWSGIFWGAIGIAVLAHVAVAFAVPGLRIGPDDWPDSLPPGELLQLVRMADVEFRAPTDADIPVPELPIMDLLDLDIDLESTIELPDFSDFEGINLNVAPPIRTAHDEWLDYKTFAPYVVRPEIRNREELRRFLETNYQRIYEYSGATGVVQVTFWVDEAGAVEKAEIRESSGVRSLDRLALRLSRVLRFRPAMMAGRPIRILVHVPITFRAA